MNCDILLAKIETSHFGCLFSRNQILQFIPEEKILCVTDLMTLQLMLVVILRKENPI